MPGLWIKLGKDWRLKGKMGSMKKALFWKLLERGGAKGLRLLIQIVLARILAPEEFGLLAILLVFVSLSDILILGGLGASLLRMPNARRIDYSTAFWLSGAFSLVAFVVLSLLSPSIASFYMQPDLVLPLIVLALQFFPLSFNNIQVAKTTRDLNTKPIFVGVVSAELLAGVVALILAYCGLGLWSLVVQQLLGAVATCLFTAILVRWRPYFEFSRESARELLRFGYKVMLTDLLNNSASSLYTMAIGKVFSPAQLGFYSQGQKYPLAISEVLTGALTPVLLAGFAEKRHRARDEFMASTRQAARFTSILLAPATAFCILFASDIVSLLLTDKWLPCVPVFQLYCVASLSRSLTLITRQGIMATGNARDPLLIAILKLVSSLALFGAVVFMGGGLTLITAAWVCACLIEQGATMASARKSFGYKISVQCFDILPGMATSFSGLALAFIAQSLGLHVLMSALVFAMGCLPLSILALKGRR